MCLWNGKGFNWLTPGAVGADNLAEKAAVQMANTLELLLPQQARLMEMQVEVEILLKYGRRIHGLHKQ